MTDYSELKRLAEAAAPGPWVQVLDDDVRTTDDGYGLYQTLVDPGWWIKDAAYIAAASPDVVLALIAENENFRRILDRAVFVDAPSQDAAEVTQ